MSPKTTNEVIRARLAAVLHYVAYRLDQRSPRRGMRAAKWHATRPRTTLRRLQETWRDPHLGRAALARFQHAAIVAIGARGMSIKSFEEKHFSAEPINAMYAALAWSERNGAATKTVKHPIRLRVAQLLELADLYQSALDAAKEET